MHATCFVRHIFRDLNNLIIVGEAENIESTNYANFSASCYSLWGPNLFLFQNNVGIYPPLNVEVQFSFVTPLLPLCSIFA